MDLNEKTALITGGNSGLGFEIARELVKKSCKITMENIGEEQMILFYQVDYTYALGIRLGIWL